MQPDCQISMARKGTNRVYLCGVRYISVHAVSKSGGRQKPVLHRAGYYRIAGAISRHSQRPGR